MLTVARLHDAETEMTAVWRCLCDLVWHASPMRAVHFDLGVIFSGEDYV